MLQISYYTLQSDNLSAITNFLAAAYKIDTYCAVIEAKSQRNPNQRNQWHSMSLILNIFVYTLLHSVVLQELTA